jgi:hypothetical protein
MIALAHYDPNTGVLFGVWLPPGQGQTQPTPYYPGSTAAPSEAQKYITKTVMAKGSEPDWDDWFDQLGDGLPYGALLVSFEVAPGTSVPDVFLLATQPGHPASGRWCSVVPARL